MEAKFLLCSSISDCENDFYSSLFLLYLVDDSHSFSYHEFFLGLLILEYNFISDVCLILQIPLQLEMAAAVLNTNGYTIENPVQKRFFRNPDFCLWVQEYVQNLLSLEIAIILQRPRSNQRNPNNESAVYNIHVLDPQDRTSENGQAVADCLKNLFQAMQSQTFSDSKSE